MLPLQFRLNPRDRAGFSDFPFYRRLSQVAALGSLAVSYQVPGDQVLVLVNFTYDVTGAGGATVDGVGVRVLDQGQNELARIHQAIPGAVTRTTADRQFDNLWIPPNAYLQMFANFSASPANNSLYFDISGLLVARGNFPAV